MTFAQYFYKRFFTHILFITTSIALLFCFVEFFEKMVRVSHATLSAVATFTALNFLPTFFETLPLSVWLATCLFIKELHQQKEWETLSILNVNHKKLFSLFLGAGIILSVFSFVGKELVVHRITQKAENYRLEQFKQRTNKKLLNSWFKLSESEFCYFDFLDIQTNTGNELTIVYLDKNNLLKNIIMGKTFKINEETNYIEIQNGTSFDITTHEYTDIKNKVIEVQNLQKQITFATQTPTSFHIMYYLFGSASQLPQNVKDNLLKTLLKNLLEHIQLILYVLLPFVLFFLFPHHQYIKWILILVPYPLITIINMTLDSLANATQIPYAMLLPYILLFLIIIFLRRKISE